MLTVGTVNNFQGEEAQIIIVSLVRSNKEKKVGFLRTTNRINILLSRAKHGMYPEYMQITMQPRAKYHQPVSQGNSRHQ
jgi:hypothetical protein